MGGGRWVSADEGGDQRTACIEFPYPMVLLDMRSLITAALHRRTGAEWDFVFGHQQADYEKWSEAVESTHPPTPMWAL